MLIQNLIPRFPCARRAALHEHTTLCIHRVGKNVKKALSLGDTALEIATAIKADRKIIPYSFLIEITGAIAQVHPLAEASFHRMRFGIGAVGIAVIGDFRVYPPAPAQRNALIELLSVLSLGLGLDHRLAIRAHSEFMNGTSGDVGDIEHDCPGPHLGIRAIRDEAGTRILHAGRISMEIEGIEV